MAKTDRARWLWLLLPPALMLAFNLVLGAVLSVALQGREELVPQVLFYVPFLSVLPPLMLWLLAQRQRGDDLSWIVATREERLRDIILGLLLAVPAVAIFLASRELHEAFGVAPLDLAAFPTAHLLFFSTIGALVPGVAEEIYFRGFLMARLREARPIVTLLATSLSFAFWHLLTPSYLLHTFLLGVIFGIAYQRTGRLLPVIVAHTAANASVGLLILLGVL